MKKCLFHTVELVKWLTFLTADDHPAECYEGIVKFSCGDVMEWILLFECQISKCKHPIKYITMYHLESIDLDPFS